MKLIRNIIAVLMVVMAIPGLTMAQQRPTVNASLDSTAILIGDQVVLHLRLELDKSYSAHLPELPQKLSEFVEVLEQKPEMTDPSGANNVITRDYVVTSFDSGFYSIDPIWIYYQSGNSTVDSVATNPLQLAVYTIPKLDSLMQVIKGPIDIKAPYDAPLSFKEVAPWFFGAILLAGLVFLIIYAISRYRSKKPFFSIPEKPKEPAHVIALRELDRIKEEKSWQQGKTKLYYSDLTETLRRYLEDRFGLKTMEKTTDEILISIKKHNNLLDDRYYDELSRILYSADLVKFAKHEPFPDENDAALAQAYLFVNQTMVKEEEPMKEESEKKDVE